MDSATGLESATFTVENIGGIESATVTLEPGVTLLTGRNATNRTSFLQAIAAAHGSEWTSVKADASRGTVRLSLGEETYERTVTRTEDGVVGSGSAVLADPTLANLFAFLLADNEARQAVVRGADLRDVIMRPVDITEIREDIRDAEERKDAIDDQLDHIAALKQRLPELERERERKRAAVEETREELAAVEARLDERDLNVDPTRANTDARTRKRELSTYASRLQTVIGFNEDLLDGEHAQITEAIGTRTESVGDLTDQLYRGSKTTCWTCGSTVKLDRIESTLSRMREHRAETLAEVDDIEAELAELTAERDRITETVDRRAALTETLEAVDAEIGRRQDTLEEYRERRDNLSGRVAELEADVTDLRSSAVDEVLDLHTEANELEFELDELESALDELDEEIADVESEIRRDEALVDRREAVVEELIDLRTRIDTLESEATRQFNERMSELLGTLSYENVERIWLERVGGPADSVATVDTDSVIEGSTFELHIVRSSEGGTVYEDSVENLSESEREVTGLVFALAGYLVHEVHEQVPFMLLDSLEAIDADRIAALVDYFAAYAPYLVVALLPEDARALSDSYDRVTDIGQADSQSQ